MTSPTDLITGMLREVQYRYWQLLRPESTDFVSMGFGIANRRKRFSQYWKRHLNSSKEFVREAALSFQEKDRAERRAAVLGSGRLYDLDLNDLTRRFEHIDLYDADPTCRRSHLSILKGSQRRSHVKFQEGDLTGVLSLWNDQLRSLVMDQAVRTSEVADALRRLQAEGLSLCGDPEFVVSLNLLGQIPLYWRDRVHGLFERFRGVCCDDEGNLPEELQEALEMSMAELQRQHLKGLDQLAAKKVILIFDSSYCYYLSQNANWVEQSAVYCAEVSSLLSSYQLIREASWWWNIVPPNQEGAEHGTAHKVRALEFARI